MGRTNPSPVLSGSLHVWEVTADGTTQRVCTEDEAQAHQAALAARDMTAWPHPRRVQVECVPATNSESITMIPSRFISDTDRAVLLQRAEAGEDVYAYRAANPVVETWNVWDTDTRIVLPLVERAWRIIEAHHLGQGAWQVVVTRGDKRRTIRLHISPSVDYADDLYGPRYQARAERRICDAVNDRAYNDADPATLEGVYC
jgi:hypothetical protein